MFTSLHVSEKSGKQTNKKADISEILRFSPSGNVFLLTQREGGGVLILSHHPDRVSDEVVVQHGRLPLWVVCELMKTRGSASLSSHHSIPPSLLQMFLLTCLVSGSMRSKKALTVARTSSLHLEQSRS